MFILTVILSLVLGAGFMMAGAAKLMGQPMMEETRTRLGVEPNLWKTIGGLELAGAAGILLGLQSSLPLIGVLAAIGAILLMAGAVFHHQKADDEPKLMMPALGMGALAILYVIFRVASA